MKMDDKSLPLCSQSFFVSQRTGPNKLSLTMKSLSKSKNSSKNRGRKSIRSQGSFKTRTSSGPHTRCGGKGSHSGTMELYFGGAKDPGTSCIHINENDGPSTSGTSGCQSFSMDADSYFPPADYSFPKFNEDSRLSADVIDSCKGDDGSECESTVEAQVTESIALLDNDPIDGARTTDKAKEEKADILMCPICWKSFESKDTQTAHMKLCAAKHKMSTKQLLDALELVQRQEAERKSLGLPLLANKIFKKPKKEPSQTSVRPKTASDGYLQLGLALSASLIEAEKEKERNHLLEAGLVEEANEKGLLPTQEISESIPTKPAPIFLNVGKKSGDEVRDTNKVRRRNAKYNFGGRVPAILRRTAEERERLITEKVAVILVGDEAVDSSKCNSPNGSSLSTWDIRSKEMKNFVDKENTWWMLAGVSPSSVSQDQYYVDNLNGFISPSKVVAGAKLKHLSQIPGRNNTPGKTSLGVVAEQEKIWSLSAVKNVSGIIESHQHSSKKLSVKRNLFSESPKANPSSSLSNDWNLLVGKKEMIDITIFTQEDREIPAHKLVFYVRCPCILKDLVQERRCNETSEMLIWNEACYLAVVAFLKFIYAGELPKASTLDNYVIEDLKKLCSKYHLSELLSTLEKNYISCESSKYFATREAATHVKVDLPAFQKRKISVPKCETDNPHSKTVSPKVSNYEELPLSSQKQEIHETEIDIKSPEIIKDDSENDFDNVIVRSSTSPVVSLPNSSSPDVFLGSNSNLSYSPIRSMVVDEVLTVNETLEDSSLSESSRSSIDYLVSLMEKDSKSSDISGEPRGSVSNGRSITEIPNNSKTLNHSSNLVSLGNDIDRNSPVTPSSLNKTGDILVYPTPVPGERNTDRIVEISAIQDSKLVKDPKRKLQNSDDSESSTPTSKKVCLTDYDGDSLAVDGASPDEKEVVDLTLSSPDGEDAPENDPLNCSNISTIPPPPEEEPSVFEEEKENSNASDSIPDNCHISNIWEGFENISDGGYVVTNGLNLDPESDSVKSIPLKDSGDRGIGPESDSVKSIPLKGSEDATSCVSPVSDKCMNVEGPKKNINVINEMSSSEDADSIGSSACMRNKDKEQYLETPLHGIGGNDVDGVDITEKLLNVSLQRINDSVFWRDENEPVEGLNGVKSSSSTPKTPIESKVRANASNKETPVNSSGSKFIRSANVTPMADFSAMKTPTLHKELDRYGIKHLKRNQAKKILRHIYNELHPVVSTSNECNKNSSDANAKKEISSDVSAKIPVVQSSKDRQGSSRPKKDPNIRFVLSSDEGSSPDDSSGSDSDSVIFEESMCEQMESPLKEMTLSQRASALDLPTGMKILIESNPEIHKKILLYEPLWLNDIKLALKEVGAKFNANQLMNYLDEQCITFRLAPGNRHRRKKAPKEKSIPLSQPCRSRSKGCRSISSSQPC